MRPLIPLFTAVLGRHRRCRYYHTLSYYCPVRTNPRTGKFTSTLTPRKTRLSHRRYRNKPSTNSNSNYNDRSHGDDLPVMTEADDYPITQLAMHDTNLHLTPPAELGSASSEASGSTQPPVGYQELITQFSTYHQVSSFLKVLPPPTLVDFSHIYLTQAVLIRLFPKSMWGCRNREALFQNIPFLLFSILARSLSSSCILSGSQLPTIE